VFAHSPLGIIASTCLCAAGAVAATAAGAQAPPAAADKSPHSFTGNVGVFSQYIFRGLTQTNRKPALQGGLDYAHAGGFYAGLWGSNVSWVTDTAETAGIHEVSNSLELDLYLGYRGTIVEDLGFDVGFLRYEYPGDYPSGFVKPNTNEIYGALSWKWLTFKASYSLGDTFGVDDARGTQYYDLTASFPVTEQFSVIGHVGYQKFRGSIGGVSNDDLYSYADWKLEGAYTVDGGWTFGAAYTDTNAEEAGYTVLGRHLGKAHFYAYVKKTF
jgi:uncharacterized protein (TIGR02001 family)